MDKTNYSVARVQTYTRSNIGKAERHNERKNKSYSNMNVDLTQTHIYYSGVGIILVPSNEYDEYDFEKAFQKMLQNKKTA